MKQLVTTKRSKQQKKTLSRTYQKREQTFFTPGFFRFLLGFTVIIGISFGILVVLGLTGTT